VNYKIPNIHCNHCVHTIMMEIGEIPGVSEVKADKDSREATIVFDLPATEDQIKQVLKEINYPPVN